MAFEMFAEEISERIEHNEEYIFQLVRENKQYPVMNWLWQEFYKSPIINTEKCNLLVHELIKFGGLENVTAPNSHTIRRLTSFFSTAYTLNIDVKSSSD